MCALKLSRGTLFCLILKLLEQKVLEIFNWASCQASKKDIQFLQYSILCHRTTIPSSLSDTIQNWFLQQWLLFLWFTSGMHYLNMFMGHFNPTDPLDTLWESRSRSRRNYWEIKTAEIWEETQKLSQNKKEDKWNQDLGTGRAKEDKWKTDNLWWRDTTGQKNE